MITKPIKWHGGKDYLAPQIVALMPPRCKNPNKPEPDDPGWLHYVEPYFGGGSVLLANDPEGISEVVNDLDVGLSNFWSVLQDEAAFQKFIHAIGAVAFSEREWAVAGGILEDWRRSKSQDIPNARAAKAFFTRCRQSMAGRMDCFTPLVRNRTRRGMQEHVSAWLTAVEGLPAVHERLRRVAVLGPKDALEVIRQQDGPRTLFYLDPPYLHETRATTGEYRHEMTEEAHSNLLHLLGGIEGRFLLSGYPSGLYESFARRNNWNRHDFEMPNNAAGGKEKRRMTECVWSNF